MLSGTFATPELRTAMSQDPFMLHGNTQSTVNASPQFNGMYLQLAVYSSCSHGFLSCVLHRQKPFFLNLPFPFFLFCPAFYMSVALQSGP